MRITILHQGKTAEKTVAELQKKYIDRIRSYCDLTVKELPDVKGIRDATGLREKEGERIMKEITRNDYIILLDEKGSQISSAGFADFILRKQQENRKHLVFITGGPYGFAQKIYERADEKISLSNMTFPHQLVRIIFAEQLYRAFTILNREQYHH